MQESSNDKTAILGVCIHPQDYGKLGPMASFLAVYEPPGSPCCIRPSRAFRLQLAELKMIRLEGGGAVDENDLQTQLKLREISGIVKRLLGRLGDRVRVQKSVRVLERRPLEAGDLTRYGDAPTQVW